MSKKIIGIDVSGNLYPLLLKLKDVDINLLYVDSKREVDDIKQKNPNLDVYYGTDATKWNSTFVSKEEILKYRSIQLKVERFANRFEVNRPYAQSQYYHALAFWIYHLTKTKIDCVLIGGGAEHGSPLDSIPLDLSKYLGIPVFFTTSMYVNKIGTRYKTIKCQNTGKYIDISELGNTTIEMSEVVSSVENCDDTHVYDFIQRAPKSDLLKKITINFVDACAQIIYVMNKITGKTCCMLRIKNKIIGRLLRLYFILSYAHIIPNQYNESVNALSMTVNNPNGKLSQYKHSLKKLAKYYQKHSVKNIDKNRKCIVYAMHYEPEAAIMVQTAYESQLYNIDMLVSAIPDDWTLYVKEHPDQLKSYELDPSSLSQIQHYKSEYFYNKLLNINNVELLDSRISSSELLDETKYPNIMAFSTINGTIATEALYFKKPILLFDVQNTLLSDIDGIFNISNIDDLKDAVNKLSTGYHPNYGDFEDKITRYLFKETYELGSSATYELDISVLQNLIENAQKYIS